LVAGGGVTLVTQTGRVTVRPQDSDPQAARFRLFDHLARLRADADTSLADALRAARLDARSTVVVLTSWGDPTVTAFLTEAARRGSDVRVLFFEPASFGGPSVMSPAVAGEAFTVVRRGEHSPWEEGGKGLGFVLREPSGGRAAAAAP
jgi:hypothetical protein